MLIDGLKVVLPRADLTRPLEFYANFFPTGGWKNKLKIGKNVK